MEQVREFVKKAKVFDDLDTALEYVEDKCIVTQLSQFEMLESGMGLGPISRLSSRVSSNAAGAEEEDEEANRLLSETFGSSAAAGLNSYANLPALDSYEDLANLSYDMYDQHQQQQMVYETEEDRVTIMNNLCRKLIGKVFGYELINTLATKMQHIEVSRGDVVYEEGQIARGAYLLISGELSLYTGPVRVHTHMGGDFSPLTQARIGPAMDIPRTRRENHRIKVVRSGEFLCDSALYGVFPHSNTMIADSYATILLLTRDSVLRLEHENPKEAMRLHFVMATRLSREVASLRVKSKSRRSRGRIIKRSESRKSIVGGEDRSEVITQADDNAGVGGSGWRGLYRRLTDRRQYARRHMSACD